MFDFRIIELPDGNQVIDKALKTPEESLTGIQMIEYMEMESVLLHLEEKKRKAYMEAERRRKLARNPFYRLACMLCTGGLV